MNDRETKALFLCRQLDYSKAETAEIMRRFQEAPAEGQEYILSEMERIAARKGAQKDAE